MSKFNQATKNPALTTNYAGGQAFQQSGPLELVSILFASFGNDTFYRSAEDTFKRLKEVLATCDKEFAAKAIVYARTVFDMRTISHVAASEMAKHVTGQKWATDFYKSVIDRPDDMLEIAAYYHANNAMPATNKRKKKDLPSAMKRGFAGAFGKFTNYQLAKYRGEGKEFSLVDVVNIVHPASTEKNKGAIEALVKNELKSFDTWESELSKAGQEAETEEQLAQAKGDVWTKKIKSKNIGYMALVRNLRNIMEQAPGVLDEALAMVTDEARIKKSRFFPFQYLIAYKQFTDMNTKEARKIADALSRAVDISCANVKELNFEGNTLVAIDNSDSMTGPVAGSAHMKRSELGALFGIILAKAINADIMEFATRARYIPFSLSEHSMDFAASFRSKNQVDHGTDFHKVFQLANKKYDRIVFFSDCQGWIGHTAPTSSLADYSKRFDVKPFIYSFDLSALGTMQFPESRIFCIPGFSEQVFSIMKKLEIDKQALINEINKIEFKS